MKLSDRVRRSLSAQAAEDGETDAPATPPPRARRAQEHAGPSATPHLRRPMRAPVQPERTRAPSSDADRAHRLAQLRREIDRILKKRPVAARSAAPSPTAPSSVALPPVAPSPVAPPSVAPPPVAPPSVAPSPVEPPPVAPSPVEPSPCASSPVSPSFVPRPLDGARTRFRTVFSTDQTFGDERLTLPADEQRALCAHALRLGIPRCQLTPPPEAIAFLDIETTGLSRAAGTLAFLVGVGRYSAADGSFWVDQLLLREPAQEAALMEVLADCLHGAQMLVTFNGRGFDVPVLQNRALLTRTPLEFPAAHLDLLPLCRRLFRSRLSDCRLGTLEREVLGFHRVDDLPGAMAPRIYTDFLRTGKEDALARVMEHNLYDVVTMGALLWRVGRHLAGPLTWAEDGEELTAAALLHLKAGLTSQGEACFARAVELARAPTTRWQALTAWAGHLRRTGRKAEAAVLWDQLRREFPHDNLGWIELAKHHEHVTRDLRQALLLVDGAPQQGSEALGRRRLRLRQRLARLGNSKG